LPRTSRLRLGARGPRPAAQQRVPVSGLQPPAAVWAQPGWP